MLDCNRDELCRKPVSEDKYYNNFSKYLLSNTLMQTAVEPVKPVATFEEYQKRPISLSKYKLTELKHVARHYKLHTSGNKPVIIDRILAHFRETRSAIRIQSMFRCHLVKLSLRLHGPAFQNRKMCVNEHDFYTLEPLDEIPPEQFFSFADEKNFVYGFDVFSLVALMKKTNKIVNPYNRNPIPPEVFTNLLGLYKIMHILHPSLFGETNAPYVPETKPKLRRLRQHTLPHRATAAAGTLPLENQWLEVVHVYENNDPPVVARSFPRMETVETTARNTIQTIQSQPLETRIRELFMEINLLGNYAESRWFTDLDRLRLARFYQFYYDWWNHRSRLSNEIRANICVLGDPFPDVGLLHLYPTTSLAEYKEACVRMMEYMIYAGSDQEYRKLGALQLLSVLTVVSYQARYAMPWLYESILV